MKVTSGPVKQDDILDPPPNHWWRVHRSLPQLDPHSEDLERLCRDLRLWDQRELTVGLPDRSPPSILGGRCVAMGGDGAPLFLLAADARRTEEWNRGLEADDPIRGQIEQIAAQSGVEAERLRTSSFVFTLLRVEKKPTKVHHARALLAFHGLVGERSGDYYPSSWDCFELIDNDVEMGVMFSPVEPGPKLAFPTVRLAYSPSGKQLLTLGFSGRGQLEVTDASDRKVADLSCPPPRRGEGAPLCSPCRPPRVSPRSSRSGSG